MVAPGQDRAARRRAERSRVHVGVAQTIVREAVDDRGLDQATETRQLPESDVVEDEHQYVRCPFGRTRRRRPGRARLVTRAPDDTGERLAVWVGDQLAHLFGPRLDLPE